MLALGVEILTDMLRLNIQMKNFLFSDTSA